jgi:hypothetical protein
VKGQGSSRLRFGEQHRDLVVHLVQGALGPPEEKAVGAEPLQGDANILEHRQIGEDG